MLLFCMYKTIAVFDSTTDCKVKKAYTSLGISCHNVHTKSHCSLLMHICICIEMSHNAYTTPNSVRIVAHFNANAYMHEQSTMGFDVCIVAGNT